MDCAEEISLLRRELSGVKGIYDLTFNVLEAKLTVEYSASRANPGMIAAAVARTGMKAELWEEGRERPAEGFWSEHGRGVLAGLAGASVLAALLIQAAATGEFLLLLLTHEHHGTMPVASRLLLLVCIVAGLWHSAPKIWAAARQFRADLNLLVAVSVVGALVLDEWSEAATVAFLFAMANLMETWSLARARRAIGSLPVLTAQKARVKHRDHTHEVPADAVPVGSVVVVEAGERLLFDGEVVGGKALVDQAILTGESVAVQKEAGAQVYAGTTNTSGLLEVRTTRLVQDSMLRRVLRMIEDSGKRRAAAEQWVERFARVYTPVVLAAALVVAVVPPLAGWGSWEHWFYQSMVVLLISCPCALLVSTPVTILAALASAARNGVLVKGGASLEAFTRVDVVAFDKTGVLTEGAPEVRRFETVNGCAMRETLALLAGLEQRSEHPLARALVRHALAQGVQPEPVGLVERLPGKGARTEYRGELFWAGGRRLLEEQAVSNPLVAEKLKSFEDLAATLVVCGDGRQVHALAAVCDPMRREVPAALQGLRKAGVARLELLSGDTEQAARAVGRSAGVDDVRADLLPEEKAARIEELKGRYKGVAMVGDGLNDLPALKAATVGVALVARSSDVALEAADIVLMNNDLRLLGFLRRHGQRTLGVIRQNVLFSVGMKVLFLTLAATGHATLWMAIAADMGATLLVALNGLRLLEARRGW